MQSNKQNNDSPVTEVATPITRKALEKKADEGVRKALRDFKNVFIKLAEYDRSE